MTDNLAEFVRARLHSDEPPPEQVDDASPRSILAVFDATEARMEDSFRAGSRDRYRRFRAEWSLLRRMISHYATHHARHPDYRSEWAPSAAVSGDGLPSGDDASAGTAPRAPERNPGAAPRPSDDGRRHTRGAR